MTWYTEVEGQFLQSSQKPYEFKEILVRRGERAGGAPP